MSLALLLGIGVEEIPERKTVSRKGAKTQRKPAARLCGLGGFARERFFRVLAMSLPFLLEIGAEEIPERKTVSRKGAKTQRKPTALLCGLGGFARERFLGF